MKYFFDFFIFSVFIAPFTSNIPMKSLMMSPNRVFLICVTFFSLGLPAVFSQILEYKFNDSGTTSASTGSDTTAVTLLNSSGVATDLHGGAGSGVSGLSGDLAFDNTASTGMGTAGIGGRANGGDINAVDGLSSFTILGWLKSPDSGDTGSISGARLVEKNQNTNAQISLQYHRTAANGSLSLTLGTSSSTATTAFSTGTSTLGALSSWVFFAVTYDGTAATSNLRFYVGNTSVSVTQLGTTQDFDKGSLNANTANFIIGNLNGNSRPWDGYMDNVRVYGATSGTGGVLSSSALESIRAADAVPEPQSVVLLALAGVAWLMKGRSKRRSG